MYEITDMLYMPGGGDYNWIKYMNTSVNKTGHQCICFEYLSWIAPEIVKKCRRFLPGFPSQKYFSTKICLHTVIHRLILWWWPERHFYTLNKYNIFKGTIVSHNYVPCTLLLFGTKPENISFKIRTRIKTYTTTITKYLLRHLISYYSFVFTFKKLNKRIVI